MSLPEKILIANRGEIAVRIIKTVRKLGLASVVVFHRVDAEGLAVREADEAVEVFGNPPVSAYLDTEAIVAAGSSTGCKAVHFGFGFLAENAEFAEAVAAAGMTFIGPPPAAIRAMGDKIESKRIAKEAGVPTLPGSEDAVPDVDMALAEAERIGYPVLLKASAGGGGKGMRIAHDVDSCRQAFEIASREAEAAFGDGRVFIERYIVRPKHIEVQVLADGRGQTVHLGERECSVQRRYQKVIEEAPSPAVNEETRREMGARAIALAEAVEYASAGTVEMVLDQNGGFYFLEMNTRLQVEHPVTEYVTGIDIVEEQLRIAGGEGLSFTQDNVSLKGHAIECRVYAEDADADFIPATGELLLVQFPSGPGIRVDHGVSEGQEISSAFDPMIAKVVVHASSREEAISRARAALSETILLGTVTNTAYLNRVLGHPTYEAGDAYTSFLEESKDELLPREPTDEERTMILAAGALASPRFDHRYAVADPLYSIGNWRP